LTGIEFNDFYNAGKSGANIEIIYHAVLNRRIYDSKLGGVPVYVI
jgi:hypothetical protein